MEQCRDMDKKRITIYDHEEQEKDIQDSAVENAKRYTRLMKYVSRRYKERLQFEYEKKRRNIEIWFEEHGFELYQKQDEEWSYRSAMRIYIRIDLKTYNIEEWVRTTTVLHNCFNKNIVSLRPKQKKDDTFLLLTLNQLELSEADTGHLKHLKDENIIMHWEQCKSHE